MADQEHLNVVRGGAVAITLWRHAQYQEWRESPHGKEYEALSSQVSHDPQRIAGRLGELLRSQDSKFDLRGADLGGANLDHAELDSADLEAANLRQASFINAKLRHANLAGADLSNAFLPGAALSGANLTDAKLQSAILADTSLEGTTCVNADLAKALLYQSNMRAANFTRATLAGADLRGAQCIGTIFDGADLTGCIVYGTAVWDISAKDTLQRDLVITERADSGSSPTVVTVDDLEIAQFIHLLVTNKKVRQIIDDVTSKVVLILGRFAEGRKAVLDAIREGLRHKNYVPVLFDFDKPDSKDMTGTVETLARLARFIIADLTDPSSIPHELATIVPFLRTTPVLPLRLIGAGGYTMFDDFRPAYSWVLSTYEYRDQASLIAALPEVIAPAEMMAVKLQKRGQPTKP